MQFILYMLLFQMEDDIYLKTIKLGWVGFSAVFSVLSNGHWPLGSTSNPTSHGTATHSQPSPIGKREWKLGELNIAMERGVVAISSGTHTASVGSSLLGPTSHGVGLGHCQTGKCSFTLTPLATLRIFRLLESSDNHHVSIIARL